MRVLIVRSAGGCALAIGLLANIGASTTHAQPAPGPMNSPWPRMCVDQDAHFAARMAFIETKLALKAEQKAAWDSLLADLRAAEKLVRELCQPPPVPADDPVALLDERNRRAALRSEMEQARRNAFARFRVSLDGEQQRRLARILLSFPGEGRPLAGGPPVPFPPGLGPGPFGMPPPGFPGMPPPNF